MITKAKANYRHGSDKESVCATCRYFLSNSLSCTIVQGTIAPEDTCDLYEASVDIEQSQISKTITRQKAFYRESVENDGENRSDLLVNSSESNDTDKGATIEEKQRMGKIIDGQERNVDSMVRKLMDLDEDQLFKVLGYALEKAEKEEYKEEDDSEEKKPVPAKSSDKEVEKVAGEEPEDDEEDDEKGTTTKQEAPPPPKMKKEAKPEEKENDEEEDESEEDVEKLNVRNPFSAVGSRKAGIKSATKRIKKEADEEEDDSEDEATEDSAQGATTKMRKEAKPVASKNDDEDDDEEDDEEDEVEKQAWTQHVGGEAKTRTTDGNNAWSNAQSKAAKTMEQWGKSDSVPSAGKTETHEADGDFSGGTNVAAAMNKMRQMIREEIASALPAIAKTVASELMQDQSVKKSMNNNFDAVAKRLEEIQTTLQEIAESPADGRMPLRELGMLQLAKAGQGSDNLQKIFNETNDPIVKARIGEELAKREMFDIYNK